MRAMGPKSTPEEFGRDIAAALARYDAVDAARVSERVRASSGRDRLVAEFVELYESVIEEHAGTRARRRGRGARRRCVTCACSRSLKREEYDVIYDSATFRMRDRLLRMPVVGGAARALVRAVAARARDKLTPDEPLRILRSSALKALVG